MSTPQSVWAWWITFDANECKEVLAKAKRKCDPWETRGDSDHKTQRQSIRQIVGLQTFVIDRWKVQQQFEFVPVVIFLSFILHLDQKLYVFEIYNKLNSYCVVLSVQCSI